MLMVTAAGVLHYLKVAADVLKSGKIFSEVGTKAWSVTTKQFIGKKGRYLRDLREKLGSMPFIYSGPEAMLLADYVPAALRPVDFLALESYARERRSDETSDHREQGDAIKALRGESRALLLGDAGMGKTTFFQYVATTLTFRKRFPATDELFDRFKPLPIFVPLKVLNNATPRPILTYVRAMPLFRGAQGFRYLVTLAIRGELLLLLDGYDEIYTPSGDSPSIKAEIDSLFSCTLEEIPGDETSLPELTELYRALYKNRRFGCQAGASTTWRTGCVSTSRKQRDWSPRPSPASRFSD